MTHDTDETGKALDCWQRIGVGGDRTCPELARLAHCRNCPKYADGGARMLDREPPADYLSMWTDMLGHALEDEERGTLSVVIFRIGEEWLALSAEVFEEVTELRRIHSIPHSPNNVLLGLANVRGAIQLCISLSHLLGLESGPSGDDADQRAYERMVVVQRDGARWVFAVDEMHGVHRLRRDDLQNVPVTISSGKESYTKGVFDWEHRSVGYLDEELLFSALRRSVR